MNTTGAPDPLAPAKLGPVTLRNRVIEAATYEGLSHRSLVTHDLADFHVRHAVGGVGMGGITNKPMIDTAMASGFEFVAMARALLREPDLINRIRTDESTPSLGTHRNKCMPTNFTGTRCVLVERETSGSADWGTERGYVA